jgi:hypothetical protein
MNRDNHTNKKLFRIQMTISPAWILLVIRVAL